MPNILATFGYLSWGAALNPAAASPPLSRGAAVFNSPDLAAILRTYVPSGPTGYPLSGSNWSPPGGPRKGIELVGKNALLFVPPMPPAAPVPILNAALADNRRQWKYNFGRRGR